MKKQQQIILPFFLIFGLIFWSSCSTQKPQGKTQAEVLYKEAMENVDKGRYLLAIEKLNLIKSQHPYSFYATHAELLQADILFLQENFIEAAAAYILFRDLHPKHDKLPYVIWKIAESYFYQLPSTFDRDLSPAFEAIKYYEELLQKYPDSEYGVESKERMVKINEMIKKKDLYIADFYFKTKAYDAAKFRYLDILSKYNQEELLNHSMIQILRATYFTGNYAECLKYAEQFSSKVSKQNIENELKYIKEDCLEAVSKVNP